MEKWNTVHTGLKVFAKNRPQEIAIQYYEQSLTYRELYQRVVALANSLLARGVSRGDHVALFMRNRMEMPEIFYALSYLGAAAVPINYMMAGESLAQLLNESDASWLFTETEQLPALETASHLLTRISPAATILLGADIPADYMSYDSLLQAGSTEEPQTLAHSDDVLAILYSSGTTSLPKGILINQETMLLRTLRVAMEWRVNYASVALVSVPMYHSVGHLHAFFLCLAGCKLVIMREFHPELVLQTIEKEAVTHAFFVPTQYHYLLQTPTFSDYRLDSLQLLISAAAPLSEAKKRQIVQQFQCDLTEFFGCTETGLIVTLRPRDVLAKADSLGQQLEYAEVRLVDDEGKDVGIGEDGEFVARGAVLFNGYYKLPDATRESYFPGGWFRTGDMGRVDADGFYYLHDRKKDMIISGGVNIYPRDIEEALQSHPAVFEAAVIGIPDEAWGEAVKAYVVLKPDEACAPDELIGYANARVAKFQRIKELELIASLPRNPSGKILKRELRQNAGGKRS